MDARAGLDGGPAHAVPLGVAIRWDDEERTLTLSVLDLVEAGGGSGHLRLDVVQSPIARMAAGRAVHQTWQAGRADEDEAFRAEVRLRHQIAVGEWTAIVWGRVDGLSVEDGRAVVEEVKSTALDADRLFGTTAAEWPRYAAQLAIYLWMLAEAKEPDPFGRLVLVSLSDGARHAIGVDLDLDGTGAFVRAELERLVRERERRLAWMARRRRYAVPRPFADWRAGQETIVARVEAGLDARRPVLVEAPTGLGKTAAVLHGVLRHALATDRQVFWATARTTQQIAIEQAARGLVALGLPLRHVTLGARERMCLNHAIACRPEHCRFADRYFDKVEAADLPYALALEGGADAEGLRAAGATHEVCPHELGFDLAERVDLVVGDYNYVFDPASYLRRAFGHDPGSWIVVVDEVHQLVDRARSYASPRVEATLARAAIDSLSADERLAPFRELALEALDRVLEAADTVQGPIVDGEAVVAPSVRLWRDLADRIEEIALDYALLAARPVLPETDRPARAVDPWVELGRAVLRFAAALETRGEDTVAVASLRPGEQHVGLLCLDPSPWLGARIASLAGFVGASATLRPTAFYRDLIGLDPEQLDVVRASSPFPSENRRVFVAPRVSTAYKDREAQAGPTAALMERCIRAVPGNVAAYFSSFAMLRDIASRWTLPDRDLWLQEPAMPEARRREWLERMATAERPVVLAAVLGGIFAEGIDLPPGALHGVLVCGPALPPVGLERDLLREYYEHRYGEGFRYASLVPGMTRVVQAAGRLIRRPEDHGVIVLLDRRFRWRDLTSLLPEDWELDVPDDPARAVEQFFASRAPRQPSLFGEPE